MAWRGAPSLLPQRKLETRQEAGRRRRQPGGDKTRRLLSSPYHLSDPAVTISSSISSDGSAFERGQIQSFCVKERKKTSADRPLARSLQPEWMRTRQRPLAHHHPLDGCLLSTQYMGWTWTEFVNMWFHRGNPVGRKYRYVRRKVGDYLWGKLMLYRYIGNKGCFYCLRTNNLPWDKKRNWGNHQGWIENQNPTENCVLTTFHPSFQGALLGAGSL
jgi:hypothetical protein